MQLSGSVSSSAAFEPFFETNLFCYGLVDWLVPGETLVSILAASGELASTVAAALRTATEDENGYGFYEGRSPVYNGLKNLGCCFWDSGVPDILKSLLPLGITRGVSLLDTLPIVLGWTYGNLYVLFICDFLYFCSIWV